MSAARHLLREPIFHFVVLGGVVAGLHFANRDAVAAETDRRILVTDAEVEWLTTAFQKTWQRPPTPQELKGILESHLREEILYREAVALGLDQGDSIVRRRLATKIEFLAKDLGAAIEPTEAELREYVAGDPKRYETEPQCSFSHVYFSEDRRGAKTESDARAVLAELRAATEPPIEAAERGDPLMIPHDTSLLSRREVARRFGTQFADELFQLEVGSWQGPIRSGFGLHVVRIHDDTAAVLPPFAEIRDRVRADFIDQRSQQVLDDYYKSLRDSYEIEFLGSSSPDQSGR